MSIERVVTILSPLFTALSGAIVAWVAKSFPGGPQLDPAEISGLFALGSAAGIAALLKWLHGRAHYVQLTATFEHERALAAAYATEHPAIEATVADFEKVLTAHEDQVVAKLGALVHAPPSALEVADQILAAAADRATSAKPEITGTVVASPQTITSAVTAP